MTLNECEDTARRVAMSLPPSDFGSTRAIQAFAQTLRAEVLRERARCAALAHREGNRLGGDAIGSAIATAIGICPMGGKIVD